MTTVSPRKIPVQQRSVATVACILEAAARILEEHGLGGLSTNAVARRAGISIGSLYQYFPGRDAITSALILRSHEEIVSGLEGLLAESRTLSARAAIGAMLDMLLRLSARGAHLNRILEAEEARLEKSPAILAEESKIDALNQAFFSRFFDPRRCSDEQVALAASEVIAIVRAMLDGPTQPGDPDRHALRARIQRTVEGIWHRYFTTKQRADRWQ